MSYPHMPLYTADFIADTTHLEAEETGAYLMLLMIMWQSPGCRLPDIDERLRRWARCSAKKWKSIKPVVFEYFEQDAEGFWFSPRLQAEHEKLTSMMAKRSEAGRRGGLASAQKRNSQAPKNQAETTVEHPATSQVASSSPDLCHREETNVVPLRAPNAPAKSLKNKEPAQAKLEFCCQQTPSKRQPSRSRSRSREDLKLAGLDPTPPPARACEAPPQPSGPAGRPAWEDFVDREIVSDPPSADPGLEAVMAAMDDVISPHLPGHQRRDDRWLRRLIADGYDLEAQILPAIRERVPQLPPGSVRSPGGYFEPVVRDWAARNQPPGSRLLAWLESFEDGVESGEVA